MANGKDETTIRIKKQTKEYLDNLEFVRKGHSYNDIISELIKRNDGKVKG